MTPLQWPFQIWSHWGSSSHFSCSRHCWPTSSVCENNKVNSKLRNFQHLHATNSQKHPQSGKQQHKLKPRNSQQHPKSVKITSSYSTKTSVRYKYKQSNPLHFVVVNSLINSLTFGHFTEDWFCLQQLLKFKNQIREEMPSANIVNEQFKHNKLQIVCWSIIRGG